MTPKRIVFCIYVSLLIILNLAIFSAPFIAISGDLNTASKIYNAMQPLCHQWIYRSACIFTNNEGQLSLSQCIDREEHNAEIRTVYTSSSKEYDGTAVYSKSQIGLNRADIVLYNGNIGYKFPVCLRDIGFYLAMLLVVLIWKFIGFEKNYKFHILFIVLCAIPMGVDGFLQIIFQSYEAEPLFRFSTGFASGFLASIYIIKNFFE